MVTMPCWARHLAPTHSPALECCSGRRTCKSPGAYRRRSPPRRWAGGVGRPGVGPAREGGSDGASSHDGAIPGGVLAVGSAWWSWSTYGGSCPVGVESEGPPKNGQEWNPRELSSGGVSSGAPHGERIELMAQRVTKGRPLWNRRDERRRRVRCAVGAVVQAIHSRPLPPSWRRPIEHDSSCLTV
jgi:hypothetical protein